MSHAYDAAEPSEPEPEPAPEPTSLLGHHPLSRLTGHHHQLWPKRPTTRCLPHLPSLRPDHLQRQRHTTTALDSVTTHGGPRSSPMVPFPTVLPVVVRLRWLSPSLAPTSTPLPIQTGAPPWMQNTKRFWPTVPGTLFRLRRAAI